jgi:CDK-activating kinase assembly factor MAT1
MEANAAREAAYAQQLKEAEEAARKEREQHAAEARRLEEAEREEREREEREIIDKLESSTDKDAARLVAQSRRDSRRAMMHVHTNHSRGSEGKRPAVVVVDPPHVPFTDNVYSYDDLYTLKEDYNDPASEAVRRDREGIMRAGGYVVSQAWERALRSALAGLDIAPLGEVDMKPLSDQLPATNA